MVGIVGPVVMEPEDGEKYEVWFENSLPKTVPFPLRRHFCLCEGYYHKEDKHFYRILQQILHFNAL